VPGSITRVITVPFAGAIKTVRLSWVRDKASVASAARRLARPAAMSSGRGPFTASAKAAVVCASFARALSSPMRASSSCCWVEA